MKPRRRLPLCSREPGSIPVLSLVLALALPAAGCGEGPAPGGESARSAGGQEEPRTGGTLVIGSPSDLGLANPLVARDASTRQVNRYMLFMPLLRFGPDLDVRPWLAESWEMVGDTAAVLHLRDDVRWHDGTRTSAHDAAFTFRRLSDPETGSPLRGHFEGWRGVQVVDSFTVRFSFEPRAEPLGPLALMPVVPRHHLDSVPAAETRRAGFNQRPVGNGPFRFVSRRTDDRWVFEANPDFPEELGGRPHLDRIVWRVIPETGSQEAALRTGEVDLLLGVRAGRFEELRNAPGLRGIVRPSRRYAFMGWNGRRGPFDDPTVRRALTMAVDRREILEALREGHGELAVGPVPPGHWLFDPSLAPLPHAPDSALALLEGSGLRNRDDDPALEDGEGEEMAFELNVPAESDFNRDMAQMIQSDLSEIGVSVRIRPLDYSTLVQRVSSPERAFDAVLMGWEAGYRLDLRSLFHSSEIDGPFQLASYRNPELDRLLDRVEGIRDREEARPLWHRLQAILREEQPWSFLYYFPDLYVARDGVRGIEMDVRGALASVDRWWLRQAGDEAAE